MCLIIAKPKDVIIPDWRTISTQIETAWDNGNDDGAGYMFALNNELIIRRPFYNVDTLIGNLYADLITYEKSAFAIHLRLATHGNKTMVHPYALNSGTVGLVHNGVLNGFGDREVSDTLDFANLVLAHRTNRQLLSPDFGRWLGKRITLNNKFVLMDRHGKMSIVNEISGHWKDGLWYSNHGYERRTYYPVITGNTKWFSHSGYFGSKDVFDMEDV